MSICKTSDPLPMEAPNGLGSGIHILAGNNQRLVTFVFPSEEAATAGRALLEQVLELANTVHSGGI